MAVFAVEALVPRDIDNPFGDHWAELTTVEVGPYDADGEWDARCWCNNRAEVARRFYHNVRVTRDGEVV